KRSSAGASCAQGPHQLAQKITSEARPPAPARRLESVAGAPPMCSRGSAGAGRPLTAELLDFRPKTASAATAATIAAVMPSARSRRPIVVELSALPAAARRGLFRSVG